MDTAALSWLRFRRFASFGLASLIAGTLVGTASARAALGLIPLQFDSPPTPPCGSTLSAQVGQTISFTVQASDADPSEVVSLRLAQPQPEGATLVPDLPAYGNPVSTVFTWTPTPDQTGSFVIEFAAANSGGQRATCLLTIRVSAAPGGGTTCTYTQGGWGSPPSGNNPGSVLAASFAAVYPTGVEIGIPGVGGYSLLFTSSQAIEVFLPTGGTPAPLTADSVNPSAKTSAGVLAGQVLALQLNVDLSAAGAIPGVTLPIGGLTLCNFVNPNLNGITVSQFLQGANVALGGGPLPFGISSYSQLNGIATQLNQGFGNCRESLWATQHLCF